MVSHPPFEIEIFDKAYIRRGWIGDPIRVECIPRHNAVGSLSVTVPSNHRRIDTLTTQGTRMVVTYKDEQVFSGPIRSISGAGPWMAGQVTFTAEDDKRLLWRMLGYPKPGSNLAGQDVLQDKRTGVAETVLKAFVSANLAGPSRWPAHQILTVATDLARGSSITAALAMQPIADVLVPLIDDAGIGFTVRQLPGNGNGLELDVYEPTVYPRPLSEEGRTIQSWSWTRTAPGATRAIVGGPAADVTEIRPWLAATATATETAYGDVIETMVDAGSEDNATDRLAAGHAALAEVAEKNGFSVELSETSIFTYGGPNGVHVGDLVPIAIGTASPVTDILRECRLIWDIENGFKPTPVVGELASPQSQLANFINRIARSMRALKAR